MIGKGPGEIPEGIHAAGYVECCGTGSMRMVLPGGELVPVIGLCLRLSEREEPEVYLLSPNRAMAVLSALGSTLMSFALEQKKLGDLLADEPVETS